MTKYIRAIVNNAIIAIEVNPILFTPDTIGIAFLKAREELRR